MAVNPLSVTEQLRPWYAAGLRFLLASSSDCREECLAEKEHTTCSFFDVASEPFQDGGNAPAFALSEPPLVPEYAPPAEPMSFFSDREPIAQARQDSLDNAPVRRAPTAAPRRASHDDSRRSRRKKVPPADWPQAWQQLFERTEPAPLVWTYAELGLDLSGKGCRERADCLRHIIGSLQLPKGSSAFWPVCLAAPDSPSLLGISEAESPGFRPSLAEDVVQLDDDTRRTSEPPSAGLWPASQECIFFQSGLGFLRPKVVVFLGSRSLELSGLTLNLNIPFTQQIHKGTLYVLLPGFELLLKKNDLAEQSSIFLHSALTGIQFASR